ncbi:hypothetical protein T71t2_18 [Escherichia phage T7]|nr:hypothetical protein T71t2_18 [Escherichia phage T7]UJQ71156.1 hypothetical protein T71t3_18 [Escherichia phage T7]
MNERHLTGAASEMLVAYKFTKAGYTVYYPMLTQSKEDLVVCKDGKFSKVQVKTLWLTKMCLFSHGTK